jgi:hypothetical protein
LIYATIYATIGNTMSKISIYIPAMKLDRIDFYCKENHLSKSKLLVMGAMSIVNRAKGQQCSMCSREAVGKFTISFYDESLGMTSEDKYLCELHRQKNQERNEVTEV